jgi:ATP-dependent Lhr-like helicase
MRALAADTARALAEPVAELGLDWRVGLRTGDTPSSERTRQDRLPPAALVTTPESLSLMLSRADAPERLGGVAMVVVDEWHELIGNKRGVQVQLALARLRRFAPAMLVWGLSATLGNPDEAMETLLARPGGRLLRARLARRPQVDTLLPPQVGRFPWGGHLGTAMLAPVLAQLEASASTLVFTNTRAQAELWYQALLEARPDWAGLIALHHGSLDPQVRAWVEAGLREARLKAVVCTSTLDLGVDFSPVERVLQVGSAKGVARLLQRAGRSGHAPGRTPRLSLVPTSALELVEAAAARDAVAAGRVEPRRSPRAPLDVLVQHLVTVAAGTGFEPADLLAEVRGTVAYRSLGDDAWQWALDFVTRGGASLAAYPEHHRVRPDEQGVMRVPDAAIVRRHRMAIGTIVSDASMQVRYASGRVLGSIEESFIARLRPGDRFLFAGRALALIRVHEMTAWVRAAEGTRGAVPRWSGGRMPLSSELADAIRARLAQAEAGRLDDPEMRQVAPLLRLQAAWSALPVPGRLVIERLTTREGHHCFVYPFAGRSAHVGLACLLAWRLARERAVTFSIAVNDIGFELLSPQPVPFETLGDPALLDDARLADDVIASLNAGELARRRFREIARVAGLVTTGRPGERRSTRQLQASASLFYEVFQRHDAANRLLAQAADEVLEHELDLERLRAALAAMRASERRLVEPPRPTPFAFPLMVERLRETLSTEKLGDRIARMVAELERASDPDAGPSPAAARARRARRTERAG